LKRALIAIPVIVVIVWLLYAYFARPGKKILFTWNNSQNLSTPNCSTVVRKRCISGFTLTDVTAAKVISSRIGPDAAAFMYIPPGGIPIGYKHTFTLATNAIDEKGVPVSSMPAPVTVTHQLWPPQGGVTALIQY